MTFSLENFKKTECMCHRRRWVGGIKADSWPWRIFWRRLSVKSARYDEEEKNLLSWITIRIFLKARNTSERFLQDIEYRRREFSKLENWCGYACRSATWNKVISPVSTKLNYRHSFEIMEVEDRRISEWKLLCIRCQIKIEEKRKE